MSWLYYLVVGAVCWSVFCRARMMTCATPAAIKLQHAAVLILTVVSLPSFGLNAEAELLGSALMLYLWADARRWKFGPPSGPTELAHEHLHAVRGRGKE